MESLKENLKEGEFLILLDFSENYSFIVQDQTQSFYWNNLQATVHPFVIYYRENNEVKHTSKVIFSDCLNHDSVAVHLFLKHILLDLEADFNRKPSKVYYFSDGAPQQYKNCNNFINLCNHNKDFGINAEWHFFPTAHGKSPCDGVGGTVKRLNQSKSP